MAVVRIIREHAEFQIGRDAFQSSLISEGLIPRTPVSGGQLVWTEDEYLTVMTTDTNGVTVAGNQILLVFAKSRQEFDDLVTTTLASNIKWVPYGNPAGNRKDWWAQIIYQV